MRPCQPHRPDLDRDPRPTAVGASAPQPKGSLTRNGENRACFSPEILRPVRRMTDLVRTTDPIPSPARIERSCRTKASVHLAGVNGQHRQSISGSCVGASPGGWNPASGRAAIRQSALGIASQAGFPVCSCLHRLVNAGHRFTRGVRRTAGCGRSGSTTSGKASISASGLQGRLSRGVSCGGKA